MREILSVLPGAVTGTSLIRPHERFTSMDPVFGRARPYRTEAAPGRTEGNGTMDLAHAIAAGGLSARRTAARLRTTDAEVREAEARVLARRTAAVGAPARRELTERGRHAAPRPAQA